jgi:hypothetical protein
MAPPHQLRLETSLPWELASRPALDSRAPWRIRHPLAALPTYCDVRAPAYLCVRYVLAGQTYRYFLLLPYPAAWRVRPVGRLLEALPTTHADPAP